jgi:hypothetical protein
MCSAGTLSAFSQEGNIFSVCCSTGEFLLDFLKVILTAIASVQLPSPTVTPPETLDFSHEWPSMRPLLLGQAGRQPPCIYRVYTKEYRGLSGSYRYVSSRSHLYPTSHKRATVEISNCMRKSCFLTLSHDSATVQNGDSRTQSFLCSAACEVQFGGYSSAGVPATIWT